MSASAFPQSGERAPVSRRKRWPLSEVGSSWDRDEDWGQKQLSDTFAALIVAQFALGDYICP